MFNFRSKRITTEKAHNVNFIFIRKFWKLFIFFFFFLLFFSKTLQLFKLNFNINFHVPFFVLFI